MDIEEEPASVTNKARFLNNKDDAFRFLCLFVSWDLLFHLSGLKTPKEICVDVIVTSECIHLYFLSIVTRCLFQDVLMLCHAPMF